MSDLQAQVHDICLCRGACVRVYGLLPGVSPDDRRVGDSAGGQFLFLPAIHGGVLCVLFMFRVNAFLFAADVSVGACGGGPVTQRLKLVLLFVWIVATCYVIV